MSSYSTTGTMVPTGDLSAFNRTIDESGGGKAEMEVNILMQQRALVVRACSACLEACDVSVAIGKLDQDFGPNRVESW